MALLCLGLSFCATALAVSCSSKPFALPITDVQVEANLTNSFMYGIPVQIGSPVQDIVMLPWAELNNTWIYDEQTYCDPTIIFTDTICEVRRGNPFLESDSSSFTQSLDIVSAGGASQETDDPGSEAGIPKLVSTSLAGTEAINLGSSGVLSRFPIGIPRLDWDHGYTTLHALGMGANSTYLNYLKDTGRIGARAWSIYWGRMWTSNNPLDGQVVLGGYDQNKVLGQNHTQALDYSSTGCWTGMKLNIADIVVNSRQGDDTSILPANTPLPVCIVPQRQLLLEAPADLYSTFENTTETKSTGLSFGLHWGAHLFDTGTQFDGDITIVLDSGLEIRVPNDQYVVPFVQIDRTGARTFNTSEMEVLISAVGDQPATLGRYFLTAAYLLVDQDSDSFTLWQANPTTDSQLVSLESTSDAQDCNNSTSPSGSSPAASAPTHPASQVSTGVIAGPVVGGLCIIIAAIVFFLFRRRKNRSAGQHARPQSQHLFKQELHGESLTTNHPPSYVTDISGDTPRGELHQTPKLQKQTSSWSGPIYEMSVGSPLPLPLQDRGSR